jgi:hypothetical protein
VSERIPSLPSKPIVLDTKTQRLLNTRGLFYFPHFYPNPIAQQRERTYRSRDNFSPLLVQLFPDLSKEMEEY